MEEKARTKVTEEDKVFDEAKVIALAIKGDRRAFGLLVKKYQRQVLRTVMGMLGDRDAAMDIVQDSFIKAYQALDRFEPGRPFYPWLSRIATNLAINYIKRQGRQTSLDNEVIERASSDPGPLEKLENMETGRRFQAALQELPEVYRVAFVLRTFEDMSYDEIANKLGISPGTVDSRLYRARRILMDKLKDLIQ